MKTVFSFIIEGMISSEACKALNMLGRGTKLFILYFAYHMCHTVSVHFPVRNVNHFMFPFKFIRYYCSR